MSKIIHIQDPNVYGKRKRSGRPKKLSERTKRRILADVSNSTKGCRTVKRELGLEVDHVTVWRAIKNSPNMIRQRMQKRPALKQQHKDARLAWAVQHVTWTKQWETVILGSIVKYL